MEQRPLRLGDIVDDYCPRERRLTNHAIVAVVDDTIKQTRCTTCDAEHVYKNGREPRIRKRAGETLYDQVLGGLTGGELKTKPAESPAASDVGQQALSQQAPGLKPQGSTGTAQGSMATPQGSTGASEDSAPRAAAGENEQTDAEKSDADAKADAWLAHRRLIRAALPKTEGELPPPRPIPEFTMHQRPQGRGGRPFRFGGGGGGGFNPGGGERNGNVAHGPGGHRHGGPHQNGSGGSNRGSWQGGGEGQGRPPGPGGGGGRRRGRRKRGGGGGGGGRGPTN